MNRTFGNICLILFALASAGAAPAQAPTRQAAQEAQKREYDSAVAAAQAVMRPGPAEIKLRDQATLHLPSGYVFVPANEAAGVLKAMGNRTGSELLGMILSKAEGDSNAFLIVQYHKSGYIKDDDAKDWNVDELFTNLRDGTEQANKDRAARGIPELEVVNWVERPNYDAEAHQLKWSISTKERGVGASADPGLNYNTYALGREGFISMNLVTEPRLVESQKPKVATLLAALKYDDGKRYSDFNSATDHVAEFGLAALIGGVAAKKLGLLALAGVFFAKFAKVIAIGALALAGGAFKFWRRKPKPTAIATAAVTPTDLGAPIKRPPDAKDG